MLPGMAPTPLLYWGGMAQTPMHMEKGRRIFGAGRRIFLQSSLGNAAQNHSQEGKTFLPCCSHKDKVLSRLPNSPWGGQGSCSDVVVWGDLSPPWLEVLSEPLQDSLQGYTLCPKTQVFCLCLVQGDTARLLEIKRQKKKKKDLMAAGLFCRAQGPCCPQDAHRGEHGHLENIIADASSHLK